MFVRRSITPFFTALRTAVLESAISKTAQGVSLVLALSFCVSPVAVQAQACAPQDEGERVAEHRLFRQLALDLLGRIPRMEEWEQLQSGASLEDVLLPAMLVSDDYFDRVREQHRALLWGSLGNVDNVGAGAFLLSRVRMGSDYVWSAGNMRRRYRGVNTMRCLNEPQPPESYDSDGRPIPIRITTGAAALERGCDPADGPSGSEPRQCREEGYVMVAPYWAPDTQIRVCAFDAQSLAVDHLGRRCDVYNPASPWCGCGPNLRYCMPAGKTSAAQVALRRALQEEPARIFESVIREGRPYHEAFTTRESWVNGASTHYYRYQSGAQNYRAGSQITYEAQMGELPALTYVDDDWMRVERDEMHSGVLTTMSYLMRFASNRARANRFFTAFRCEPFVPPAEGLPEDTSAMPNPNLRQRTGCSSCHFRLEPLASHWGRWRGNGTHGFLSNEQLAFDEPNTTCMDCGGTNAEGTAERRCAAYCNLYYVTGANSAEATQEEWEGLPLARAYLTEPETAALETGPAGLVDEADEVARVASCTIRTVAERLLARELTREELLIWVPQVAESYAAGGYNYTELVRQLVLSERYQTTR